MTNSPPPRSRKAVASGILLGAAILGLILLILDLESAARPPSRPSIAAAPDSAIPAEPDASPWVDREMVDRAVETLMMIRARGRSSDALAYSRNCFVRLDETPSALLLDHCLAFDVAAANWRRVSDAPAETDFAPQAMGSRHVAALRRVAIADGGRERLREVSLATFAALARRLRPAEESNQSGLAGNYAEVAEDVAPTR